MDRTRMLIPHVLGFLRGAYRHGASPEHIAQTLAEDFPALSAAEIADLIVAAAKWEPPPKARDLN